MGPLQWLMNFLVGKGLRRLCPTHSPVSFSEKENPKTEKSGPSLSSVVCDGAPNAMGLGIDKTKNDFLSSSSLRWTNLFGAKPKRKITSPPMSFVANVKTREYSISNLDWSS